MAITRATGKAARLSFAWIVEMAGYAPRAAEEMPGFDPDPDEAGETTTRYANQWEEPILSVLIGTNLVPGDNERQAGIAARKMLNYSPFMAVPYGKLDIVEAVAWIHGWNLLRDKHPKMKDPLFASVVKGGWDDPAVKPEWINAALELVPAEPPKGVRHAPPG